MPAPPDLEARLLAAFPDATITVEDTTGGGDHFRVEIFSNAFEGLSLVEQHRKVYDVFPDDFKSGAIHALSMKTGVPSGAS